MFAPEEKHVIKVLRDEMNVYYLSIVDFNEISDH